MKITKTIQKLLDKVETKSIYPWDNDFVPNNEHIINKDNIFPKKCVFCGEDVSLEWELDDCGGKITHLKPDKATWLRNQNYFFYHLIAPDMHPKCKKLRELFQQWGVIEKQAFKTEGFIVSDDNKDAYQTVTNWINNPCTTGLYLFGTPGVGKSLLATKIILDSNLQDKMIISETELYDRLKPRIYNKNSQKEIDYFMSTIKRTSLLIIDDLGTCNKTPWKMETLFTVVSKRIDGALSTFFTSNYSPIELSDHIDSKIVSRVFELTNPCFVGGYDHRLVR